MKYFWLTIGGLLLLLSTFAFSGTNPFDGKWKNKTQDASDFNELDISGSGSQLSIMASGNCKTPDCQWAPALGVVYADDAHSDMDSNAKILLATLPTNQGEKVLFLKRSGEYEITAQVLTRYRASTENNYAKTYVFERVDIPKEPVAAAPDAAGTTPNGEAAAPTDNTQLGAPQLVSPGNGKTLYNYPRKTTLTWKALPNATAYGLEVDCFNCCKFNQWCSTQGGSWLLESNLTNTTSYTFDFIGPQPARWRVWGINASGQPGEKSSWYQFKYGR